MAPRALDWENLECALWQSMASGLGASGKKRSTHRLHWPMAAAGAAAVASIFIFAGLAYLWENNQEAALKLTSKKVAAEERDHLTCSEFL